MKLIWPKDELRAWLFGFFDGVQMFRPDVYDQVKIDCYQDVISDFMGGLQKAELTFDMQFRRDKRRNH